MVRIKDVTSAACAIALATVTTLFVSCVQARGQDSQERHVAVVRGRVLNAITNEPIGHALVDLPGSNAATFTDDHGQFELSISETTAPATGGVYAGLGGRSIEARKLGFLQNDRMPSSIPSWTSSAKEEPPELIIHLIPEAKIVGHIDIPGSEGDVRIQAQLYLKEMTEGRETWQPQRTFTTLADGEFRFFGLTAGTYRLITHEQLDQELLATPGAQFYGYPPMYYPNTTDFSLSTPIVVEAGETARVNLTVARKEYYRVRIPVENDASARGLSLSVYPMGRPSPGWSLGYNPRDGAIEGTLPDGNYTVDASMPGEGGMTGILNFSVKGKALDGPTLTLAPDATIVVRVREEFQSATTNFGMTQPSSGNSQFVPQRYSNVNVNLVPLDELFMFSRAASSRISEGSQELTIPDVRPGRYRVQVNAFGYVSSIQSGGKDLARQPLVVALGAEVAPIEIVLRDDGAEVDGTLDEEIAPASSDAPNSQLAAARLVYLLSMGDSANPRTTPAWRGTFRFDQVPPGSYLALAFNRPQQDLPSGPGEALQRLMNEGQVLRVGAGQKVNVHLKVIASGAE